MAGNPEIRHGSLEVYKNLNKLSLVGALTVAVLVPPLVVPALAWAAVDGAQIVVIDKINKKKPKEVPMKPREEYALAA